VWTSSITLSNALISDLLKRLSFDDGNGVYNFMHWKIDLKFHPKQIAFFFKKLLFIFHPEWKLRILADFVERIYKKTETIRFQNLWWLFSFCHCVLNITIKTKRNSYTNLQQRKDMSERLRAGPAVALDSRSHNTQPFHQYGVAVTPKWKVLINICDQSIFSRKIKNKC